MALLSSWLGSPAAAYLMPIHAQAIRRVLKELNPKIRLPRVMEKKLARKALGIR